MRLRTHIPRDNPTSTFDHNHFYLIRPYLDDSQTISSGQFRQADGNITLYTAAYSSSENWQFYFQNGVYFIRNYDYADYQLGLTADERSVPRLYPRSGTLGQQWTLLKVGADGKAWRFQNRMLGNGSWLGVNRGMSRPAMSPTETGADWDVIINESAGKPKGANLFVDVEDFEVAGTASPSPTASTSTSSSSPSASAPASSTLSVLSTPISSSTSLSSSSPNPVSPDSPTITTGAIVGIAVGGFALLALAVALTWFVAKRRGRRPRASELPGSEGRMTGRWAYYWGGKGNDGRQTPIVEIADGAMVFEAQEKGHQGMRHELPP